MAVTVTNAAPPALGITGGWVPVRYGTVAGSVAADASEVFGNKRLKLTKLTLSSTYATGGFALTPSAYGLKEIHELLVVCDNAGTGGAGALPRLTTTGGSPIVKLFSDTTTELTNATSVANYVYTVLLAGI